MMLIRMTPIFTAVLICLPNADAKPISGNVYENVAQHEQPKPLQDVTVKAERDGVVIASTKTDQDGHFTLDVDDDSVDFLVFDFTERGYHLALVQKIHAMETNEIRKLLLRNPTGSDNFAMRYSLLLNYEVLYFYRTTTAKPDNLEATKRELRGRYSEIIPRLGAEMPDNWSEAQKGLFRQTLRRVIGEYTGR